MDPLPAHTIVVVSHTHWDREWYQPLGRMRQRLVRLIDTLLDAPDGLPFLLDGQAIVLDDYLLARPDRAAVLRDALRDGALEAGPWYVLADMLLPGGEALVRNLLAGRRTVRAAGGTPPAVLYSPDAFGHAAAGPVLAHGFGLDVAIVWRGFGGPTHPSTRVARWTHPGGASVLLYHLPPDGYEVGSSLPTGAAAATDRWHRLRDAVLRGVDVPVALLPNGADHHARQPHRAAAVAALASAAAPHVVVCDTLHSFARRLVHAADGVDMPTVEGELRDSRGHTWALQGTFATRAHQKRANAQAERALVHDAEPWVALAWFTSGREEHAMHLAWTTLLTTHPHDTLCGCSVDAVATAADERWRDALQQAHGLRDDAVRALVHCDAAAQRDLEAQWRATLVLRNPSARRRGGVVRLELLDDIAPDPVGPGSAAVARSARLAFAPASWWHASASVQVVDTTYRFDRVESPLHYPRNAVARATEALAWIDAMPGYAIHSVSLAEPVADFREVPAGEFVQCDDTDMRNATWSVLHHGTQLVATHAPSGLQLVLAGTLESVTDRGDTYTPSLRGAAIRATPAEPCPGERGPLRGTWRQRYTLHRPARDAVPAVRLDVPIVTSDVDTQIGVTATYTLHAGAEWCGVTLDGENTAGDHRLRWIQPLPIDFGPVVRVLADAAFGPVERPLVMSGSQWPAEWQSRTAPLHRWVWVAGDRASFAIVSDGLAEYEVVEGGIAITLVRAVGELSRRDLPERPGHAGWPAPSPLAQSLGPFAAHLAVAVLPPAAHEALPRLSDIADDVLLPLVGETWRGVATPLSAFAGLTLEGAGLECSAVKCSDDGAWLVLRCVNLVDVAVRGAWYLPRAVTEVRLSRLDEAPGALVEVAGHVIPFDAPPHAVVTMLVR